MQLKALLQQLELGRLPKRAWRLFAMVAAAWPISVAASAADERNSALVAWHDGAADFKIESTSGTATGVGGGASFSLNSEILPLSAEGSVHAGQDLAHASMWQKAESKFAINIPFFAPVDLKLTAGDETEFRYSQPLAGEMHQQISETLSGRAEAVEKAGANVSISMGAELFEQSGRDVTSGSSVVQERKADAESTDVFANAEWKIGSSVTVRVEAKEQNLSARRANGAIAKHAYFAPSASLSAAPWRGARWTLSVGRRIAPYDDALVAAQPLPVESPLLPLEPDHAWQAETKFEQRLGAALLEAKLDEDRAGTRWEIGGIPSAAAPTSAPLLAQRSADISVTLPLDRAGLPRTRVTVRGDWQSSRVVDPITHQPRAASAQAPYNAGAELSHALARDQIEIGLRGEARGEVATYAPADVAVTSAGASVGAFLRFKPGPFELDFDASSPLNARRETDLHFGDGRADRTLVETATRAVDGPSLTLALKKSF